MKRLLTVFWFLTAVASVSACAEEAKSRESLSASHDPVLAGPRRRNVPPAIGSELSLIFNLQDRTGNGEQDLLHSQKQLLFHAGPALAAFLRSAHEDEIRAIAPFVVAYVLSGGDPAIAQKLSENTVLSRQDRRLLEGSALFMKGDQERARTIFSDINPLELPARTAGHVALVQAMLQSEDSAARQQKLAIAIAAMPGSLVEESALRRSALIFAEKRDEKRFWERIGRYQRRFPNSLYARAFWQDAGIAIIDWAAKQPQFQLNPLEVVWSDIDVTRRRTLYLELTQQAAAANERRVTEFAAARLKALAASGSVETEIAKLYMSIYKITSPESATALRELTSINGGQLGQQEQALLSAALAVSAQINRPLPAVSASEDRGANVDDPLEVQGQELLEGSGKLLETLTP